MYFNGYTQGKYDFHLGKGTSAGVEPKGMIMESKRNEVSLFSIQGGPWMGHG